VMAQVPDMFHAQREYAFRLMEQVAFYFSTAKTFGDLTLFSALVRLVLSLVLLWTALPTAFALVFVDAETNDKRFLPVHAIWAGITGASLSPVRARPSSGVLE
jgi:hypothetical protein